MDQVRVRPMYERLSNNRDNQEYVVTKTFTAEQIKFSDSRYRSKIHNSAIKQLGAKIAENQARKKISFVYRNLNTGGVEYHANMFKKAPAHLELMYEEHNYRVVSGEF